MENSNGYSLSDIAAIVDGKDGDGLFGGNGVGFIILILFLLMMNGGFGGFGWGNSAAAQQITNDFLYNNLSNQLGRADDRIESVLNTGFTTVAQQGFQIDKDVMAQTTAINQTLCQGFNGVNANLNAGFNSVNANLADVGYKMQQCCCDIKTALHAEGEATRSLIQANLIQDLRDRLVEKDSTLQAANLTLANSSQTQTLLNALGNYVPAGCGCNSCGCNY